MGISDVRIGDAPQTGRHRFGEEQSVQGQRVIRYHGEVNAPDKKGELSIRLPFTGFDGWPTRYRQDSVGQVVQVEAFDKVAESVQAFLLFR